MTIRIVVTNPTTAVSLDEAALGAGLWLAEQTLKGSMCLLYTTDTNTDFSVEEPVLFFLLEKPGSNNQKVQIVDITGKSMRKMSKDRPVCPILVAIELKKKPATALQNVRPGELILHGDNYCLVVDRPEKSTEGVWAVPLTGLPIMRSFKRNWVRKVYTMEITIKALLTNQEE